MPSSSQKYFIDYNNLQRQCGICFAIMPFDNFTMYGAKKNKPRSYCKKCRSSIVNRSILEKKIIIYPYLYIDCDNCDHIYRKINKKCNKCGYSSSK